MKILALSACLAAASCITPPSDSARMAATSNVWQLHNTFTGQTASGVPIAIQDGELWLLTAQHVPGAVDAEGWHAAHRDETHLVDGRVISFHPTEDAAIMAFPLGDYEPLLVALNYEPLELGEQVYGAGWASGHYLWLTLGLVSGPDRTTSQIARGDSGGGLFNDRGELIALLVGRYSEYDAHHAAIVPLVAIAAWLQKNLEDPVAPPA